MLNLKSVALATAAIVVIAASALAWTPKADIKAERKGATSFAFVGKNSIGKLDVQIADKHLFQGFGGEGTNGDNKVTLEIKSAGPLGGWNITGKNGSMTFDLKAEKKNPLSNEWKVTGKSGDKEINETVTGNWDVDPAIVAALIPFDV